MMMSDLYFYWVICVCGVVINYSMLMSGTSRRNIILILVLSMVNSSAQSILNFIPSNFDHGSNNCPEHLPMPTTFVHLNYGCIRRPVCGLVTQ